MTLSFAAGAVDGSGNLTSGVRDKSGNLNAATSITIGKDDVDGNPGQDTAGNGEIVDVVDPIWEVGDVDLTTGTIKLISINPPIELTYQYLLE